MLAKRDFHLQIGNLGYKTGLSFTNGESWVTNGILGLLFTKMFSTDVIHVAYVVIHVGKSIKRSKVDIITLNNRKRLS